MRWTYSAAIALALIAVISSGVRAVEQSGTAAQDSSAIGAEYRATRGQPTVVEHVIDWCTRAFELAGVGVILIGTIVASGLFLRRTLRFGADVELFHGYRAAIGRSILLGLELLIAADIIATVAIRPTLMSVAVLGLIVLIRTFLSFSLEVEIEGRWPWQQRQRRPSSPAPPGEK